MNAPSTPDDRIERNKATLTRALACLSAGDIVGFSDILAPDYVRHCQAMPPPMQEIRGRDVMRQWLESNRLSFPDYREEIEWLIGESDYVAWRSRGTGTQRGPLGPFPATDRRMDIVIIGMHRFEGDFIAETWTSWDNVAALTQLGLLPAT